MALPKYESRGSAAPLPGVRVGTDARGSSGEAVGAGLQRLGAGLGQVAQRVAKEREEVDRARVQEAWTRHARERARLLREAQQKQGSHAVGAAQWGTAAYDSARNSIVGDMKLTPQQAEQLDAVLQRERVGFEDDLTRHEYRETQRYKDEQAKASAGAALELVVLAGSDARREEALGQGLAALEARLRDTGAPPEAVQAAKLDFSTRAHLGVLEKLANARDADGLEAYLAKYRPTMDALALERSGIPKVAEGLKRERKTVEVARALLEVAGEDRASALQAVSEIEDEALRRDVRALVDSRYDEVEKAQKEAMGERRARAEVRLARGGAGYVLDADPDYQRLDAPGRAYLEWRHRAMQESARNRGTASRVEQNLADRNAIAAFEAQGEEDVLQGYDDDFIVRFAQERNASPYAVDEMRQRRNRARQFMEKGGEAGASRAKDMATTVGRATFRHLGKKARETALGGLQMAAQEWHARYVQEHAGKQPTTAEVEAFVLGELEQEEVEGAGFLGTSKTMFRFQARQWRRAKGQADAEAPAREPAPADVAQPTPRESVPPAAQPALRVEDVPAEDRRLITEALQAAKRTVTPQAILDAYNRRRSASSGQP